MAKYLRNTELSTKQSSSDKQEVTSKTDTFI
jgi:hypothetical protein